jgi:NTE family protein
MHTDDTRAEAGTPVIGVALGGGAALGFAHIGVLRVLERAGIRPRIIAGTSMGAVVGAAHCCGRLDTLESIARAVDWRRALRMTDIALGRNGLLQGERIEHELRRHLGSREIAGLPLRFAAVATELVGGTRAVLDSGDLVDAVRASISLPGIFVPVRRGDSILVDGGLMDNVPVDVARSMGADLVIGVDVTADFAGFARASGLHDFLSPEGDRRGWRARLWARLPEAIRGLPLIRRLRDWAAEPSLLAVTLTSIFLMMRELSQKQNALHPADCYVTPKTGHITVAEFHRAEELIALGESAMEEALPRLLARLPRGMEPA